MRIFGIQLPPRRLSDEEYVNMIRKDLRKSHKWRYVAAAVSFLYFSLIIWGIPISIQSLPFDVRQDHEQYRVYLTFGLAFMMGTGIGLMFVIAASQIAIRLLRGRADKLLVHCWDSLHPSRNCIQDS